MARDDDRDYARVEALLTEAGLSMPPMPDAARKRLKEREEGCFSTRAFKVPPCDIQHYVRKAIGGASPDYVLIGQTGPEAAPAFYYFLVQGPLQLFLQLAWDGVAAGRGSQAARVNECFALAHQVVAAVPEAIQRGRLLRNGRLTVVASDLEESFWEVAAPERRASWPLPPSRRVPRGASDPRRVLGEALRWCQGKG